MGVNNGYKLLFTLKGLTFGQLSHVARKRAENVPHRFGTPAVAADVSWLSHKLRKKSVCDTVSSIEALVSKFLGEGFIVYVAFDPEGTRHHTKKASTYREFVRQERMVACIKAKCEILSMRRELREGSNLNDDRRKFLLARLDLLETKARTAETPSQDSEYHPQVIESVRHAMEQLHQKHPGRVFIVEGRFQADSYIQHLLTTSKVDLAIGNDADFSFIAGATCLQVSDFRIKMSRNKGIEIDDITIATGFSETIQLTRSHLGSSDNVSFKEAEHPLLDGVNDLKTRCLIAVLLGNDTFPTKLKAQTCLRSIGPATVRDMINTIKRGRDGDHDIRFDDLLQVVMKFQTKRTDASIFSFLSANVITALVDAMAFEPAMVLHSGELVYSVEAPSAPVDHYLCDFTHTKSMVVSNCELAVCLGPTSIHSHTFMVGEGSRSCEACRRIFCHMCVSSDAGLCIMCLGVGGGVNIEDASVALLSERELRHALSEKMEVPALLPIGDLQELYISVVENNSMDSLGSFLLEQVTFPIYPSIALSQDQSTFKYLLRFDFHDGGRFLRNNALSTKQRCGVLNLFASLVTFCNAESTSPKAAMVLPSMISHFAKNARVDSGERLMKRAIRHSLDTKTPPILHAQACVIEHQGEIGLVIEDKIAASMKDDVYNVKVAFTPSKLLGSACDCKAGSDAGSESGRHICVHCLPVLYKLTLLLFGGLAEHVLVEFASCFTRHHEAELSEEETTQLVESIHTLMESSMGAIAGESLSCAKSPSDVLAKFSVGTELKNTKLPEPPNPSELRPLREFKRISPEGKAKLMMKMKKEEMKEEPPRLSVSGRVLPTQSALASEDQQPDYITISRLCRVLLCRLGKPTEKLVLDETVIVGIRLLELRADKLSLTTMAKDLIDLGLQEKVHALVDGGKLRRRPKCLSSSCHSKEPGVAHGIRNLKRTFTSDKNVANAMMIADGTVVVNPQGSKTKQRKRKRGIRRCYFTDCDNSTERGSQRVPAMPPKPKAGASPQRWETYFRKKCHRQEFLRRIGENPNDQRANLRICSCHPKESNPVSIKYTVKIPVAGTGDMKTVSTQFPFHNLPIPLGMNSNRPEAPTATVSKGTGVTRQIARFLGPLTPQRENVASVLRSLGGTLKDAGISEVHKTLEPIGTMIRQLQNDGREGMTAVQQIVEVGIGGRTGLTEIHPRLRKLARLDEHVPTPPRKKPRLGSASKKTTRPSNTDPVVLLESVPDSEVHQRTGFPSLMLLLFYVSVVCDGNVEAMIATATSLTWFEEWFFFLEMIWGRSFQRWVDARRIYKIHHRRLRKLFDIKLSMVMSTIALWPRYAYHDEDVQLRSTNWKERYNNKRIIMWDNTNLDFMGKPTDADLQRLTFSLYYSGNVAKGGVFLQLGGWLGAYELWLGAVSDSDYQERSGVLEFQRQFQKLDKSSELCFTNIVDKGYRCVQAAWRAGGQLLLQPFFARSDRKFSSREVLLSGAVASDRSGNERAVNRLKSSWMLARGIHQKQDLCRFADLWIAYGFQCNFMFKPVL